MYFWLTSTMHLTPRWKHYNRRTLLIVTFNHFISIIETRLIQIVFWWGKQNSKWLHEWTDSDVLQMPCLEMALLHHVWAGLTLWPCSHSAWWVMSPRGHSSCWWKNMTYTYRVNTYIGCFHESAVHREMNNTTMLSDFSPEEEWVGNVGKREKHSFSDSGF